MDDLTVSRPIPSQPTDDRGQPPARRRPRTKPKTAVTPAAADTTPGATSEAADDRPHVNVLA